MRPSKHKPIKVIENKEKWLEGEKGRMLLGDARLTQFLDYLRAEQPPTFWTTMFFQKLEQGNSLESLTAPKSGYRLAVQKEPEENKFIILFGFYTPGHRIGHIANDYHVTFDEANTIEEIVPRGRIRG